MRFACGHAMVRSSESGKRRVAVPILQRRHAEPLGLELVIAMRQARIGLPHRRDQRVDHLVLDIVREIARRDRALELAPAVLDLLVLRERVGDLRDDADIVAEHLADGLGGGLAQRRIRFGQQMQRLGAGQLLAVDRESAAPLRFRRTDAATPKHRQRTFRAAAFRDRPTIDADGRRGRRAATADNAPAPRF